MGGVVARLAAVDAVAWPSLGELLDANYLLINYLTHVFMCPGSWWCRLLMLSCCLVGCAPRSTFPFWDARGRRK